MARQPPIKVEGLDHLRKELRRVHDKELDAEMKATHLGIAKEVIEKALPNVPVLTGALKATVRGSGTVRDAIGRAGTPAVPYGPPIHWGWPAHNIKPHEFLADAAKSIEAHITERYDAHVARMLDKTIGTTFTPK